MKNKLIRVFGRLQIIILKLEVFTHLTLVFIKEKIPFAILCV